MKSERALRVMWRFRNSIKLIMCFCVIIWTVQGLYVIRRLYHNAGKVKGKHGAELSDVTRSTMSESESADNSSADCTVKLSELRGREEIDSTEYKMQYLEDLYKDTETGGRWRPTTCRPQKRIAIIIPLRDRQSHFLKLLKNLIPKLRRQKVDYTIYVIEQDHRSNFNRGMVKNIGFVEVHQRAQYDCYIFNDVDTVIEDDYNFYTCKPGVAYHMSVRMERLSYQILYSTFLGGIVSFTSEAFTKINGYTNFFFMWGGEDDDIWRRLRDVGSRVERPPDDRTFTATFSHEREKENFSIRQALINDVVNFANKDGINSLKYHRNFVLERTLFTLINVDIDETYYSELLESYRRQYLTQQYFVNGNNDVRKSSTSLKKCERRTDEWSPLERKQTVDLTEYDDQDILNRFNDTEIGGRWTPTTCYAETRKAIIIPYHNHRKQLKIILNNLIPRLWQQNTDYTIYVIQQEQGSRFNPGMLKNIGFQEAVKEYNYGCYIFHDIDIVVSSDFTVDRCESTAIAHMSTPRVDENNLFATTIEGLFGHLKSCFMNCNGFSNFYFGSGMDNDDLYRRILNTTSHGIRPWLFENVYAQRLIPKKNSSLSVYNTVFPFVHKDGLNSLQYKVISNEKQELFTWIRVSINETFYDELLKEYIMDEQRNKHHVGF